MEAPKQITPTGPGDYLAIMTKAVFQSGMSWKVVEAKWPGITEALHDFDVDRVSRITPRELEALTEDTRVIRNRRKLAAIVENAVRVKELSAEHGSFGDWLGSHGDYDATEKAVRKNFKFMGEMGTYFFLYVVGHPVPSHEEWRAARGRA